MAAAPAVDFACEHGAGRAPEQQVAADPPPWERRENEEVVFFKATFKGFICKSFHVPEQRLWGNSHWVRVVQSLTGNQDLCPILVCLILRLPGSNHSSLLRIHGLRLDSVKYPRQPESKTNPMKRLASTGCPTCAVCGCVPPVPAQHREPLHARAWPPVPGEGSRR